MKSPLLLTEISDRVGWIKINRPDKLNALNQPLIQALHEQLEYYRNHSEVRAVILTGSGDKAFVAGADIKEFSESNSEQGRLLAQQGEEKLFSYIEHFNKPVLAAVNGYALGGGLELALACHLRVASDTARLGLPEVSLGLIPGYGGTQRLPHIIGKGRAMEMILTTQMVGAQKALEWGLVNAVAAPSELLAHTAKMASQLLKQSPNGMAKAITAIQHAFQGVDGLSIEKELFGACFDSPDFQEGVSAFLAKRKARF